MHDGDRFGLRGTGSKDWFYFFAKPPLVTPAESLCWHHAKRALPLDEILASQRPKRACLDLPANAATAMDNGTWSSGCKPKEAESLGYSFFANPKGPCDSPKEALQLHGDSYYFNTIHLRQPGDVGQSTGQVQIVLTCCLLLVVHGDEA